MKPVLIPSLFAFALAIPASAAAPPFETIAPIAYMEDLSSGAVLYNKGGDQRMPPASMAKMMTVHLIFDLIDSGKLKLDQKFQVRPETWRKWHGPEAGSTMFLETGEMVTVDQLLQGIVTLSGNDACVVMAEGIAGTEEAFVAQMNARAKEIGLNESHFGTSNGWPDEGRTFVTARDLVKLAKSTIELHPKLYKQYYSRTEFTRALSDGKVITQANRDPLLGRIPGADGLKTGHTEEAGYGFTGSAVQNNRRIVMVLAGLTTFNGRIDESVKFIDWGFRAWTSKPIVAKGKRVQTAEVQLGAASEVGLIAPRDIAVTLPTGVSSKMTVKVAYNGPIKAPIKAGQHIADLIVSTPDTPPQSMPLVAESDVGEAGFFGRAWAGLKSIFGA